MTSLPSLINDLARSVLDPILGERKSCELKDVEPRPRPSRSISDVGLRVPGHFPVLPSCVPLDEIEKKLKEVKDAIPDVCFDEKALDSRHRFTDRLRRQRENLHVGYKTQLEIWDQKEKECRALEEWDAYVRGLYKQQKMTRSRMQRLMDAEADVPRILPKSRRIRKKTVAKRNLKQQTSANKKRRSERIAKARNVPPKEPKEDDTDDSDEGAQPNEPVENESILNDPSFDEAVFNEPLLNEPVKHEPADASYFSEFDGR